MVPVTEIPCFKGYFITYVYNDRYAAFIFWWLPPTYAAAPTVASIKFKFNRQYIVPVTETSYFTDLHEYTFPNVCTASSNATAHASPSSRLEEFADFLRLDLNPKYIVPVTEMLYFTVPRICTFKIPHSFLQRGNTSFPDFSSRRICRFSGA